MELSNLPEICTPEQVAKYLGVTRNTVYRWCGDGDIPSIKIRKVRRIQRSTLITWIAEREQASTASE